MKKINLTIIVILIIGFILVIASYYTGRSFSCFKASNSFFSPFGDEGDKIKMEKFSEGPQPPVVCSLYNSGPLYYISGDALALVFMVSFIYFAIVYYRKKIKFKSFFARLSYDIFILAIAIMAPILLLFFINTFINIISGR